MSLGNLPETNQLEDGEQPVHSLSPEARRLEANSLRGRMIEKVGPGTRAFAVIKRTAVGTYNDGFIHAGNLAYLAMLAIFPFFILGTALFSLFGERADRADLVFTILVAMPPTVRGAIEPVAQDVINARQGWLLWAGAAIALWTVSSLVETIRDILRRAYGTEAVHAFWKSRLLSAGLILAAVTMLIISLFAQVTLVTAEQVIETNAPQLAGILGELRLSQLIPPLVLFGSLFMLFLALTPSQYRGKRYPKWPGALLTTVWWGTVTLAMPPILRSVFSYSLTYGSLAGIMVALFFFFLVGLGVVAGAELNAALAVTPEEKAAEEAAEEAAGTAEKD